MTYVNKLGVSRDFIFNILVIPIACICEYVMKILRKIVRKWLDNMNEFYRPLIENNITICL